MLFKRFMPIRAKDKQRSKSLATPTAVYTLVTESLPETPVDETATQSHSIRFSRVIQVIPSLQLNMER